MIAISESAAKFVQRRMRERDARWTIVIRWVSGPADNWRAADGSTVWSRSGAGGWVVGLLDHPKEMPVEYWERMSEPLFDGVRVRANSDFPGGAIDVLDERLILKVAAV